MIFVKKSRKAFISVHLPVRNGESYLAEALESIISQTWQDFEVITVDHSSTDRTPEILSRFAREDSRIKVCRFEGENFVDCLNFGLSRCGGEFIARMDADDVMASNRLELQKRFLTNNPEIGVVGSAVKIFASKGVMEGYRRYEKWINSVLTPEEIRREIFIESPLPNSSVMMRRSMVEKLDGYKDFGWPEDYDLWFRAMLAGIKMAKLEKVLLQWRDYPMRMTRTDKRYSKKSFLKARAFYMAKLLDGRKAVIQGAGTTGRIFGKYLREYGVQVEAFMDINRRRVGGKKLGLPVFHIERMADFKGKVLLSAVSSWGAREQIRAEAEKAGFVEGVDFFCCS